MQENLCFRFRHEMNKISINLPSGNTLITFDILAHFLFLCYNKIASCILLAAYIGLEYNSFFNAIFPASSIIWKLEDFLRNKKFLR